MDWRMPAMNGIEATAQITSRLGLTNVPKVIMVTSHDHEVIREEAQAAGVCGLITKPVTNSMLMDAIMNAFDHDTGPKRRARRETTVDLAALAPIRGAKILLVEDNEINQQVATELLEKAQLIVTVANTGKEGVEKALADGFELILMDIQMPEMDGFEATRRIRASDLEDAKTLPIIAMTAHAMAGDKEKSLEAGMNDHLTKPIDPNGLYATLLRWIPAGAREVPAHLSEAASGNDGDVAEIALPNVPGIDSASGLTRVGGNRRLYCDLLRKFVRDYADAREQLDAALAQEDRETAQRLAHTIKGVAGNIGARSTQQAAGALEAAIRDGEADTLPDLLGAFTEALNTLVASLRQAGLNAEETDAAAVQREVGAPERLLALLS
jgi:polar amino acid transport system substrate-binding protein